MVILNFGMMGDIADTSPVTNVVLIGSVVLETQHTFDLAHHLGVVDL